MDERRRFLRLDRDIAVRHLVRGEETIEDAQAKNISTGGVLLRSRNKQTVGSKLKLQLDMPGFSDPFYAHGEVVWQRPEKNGANVKHFELGVRFLRVVNRGEMREF